MTETTWDDATARRLAAGLRLRVDPRRRLRRGGERLGAGPGASLEFHDHRTYQPGDDLRHLDWGVYARTDQLVLRRHRREVSPHVEIVVDLSASAAVTDAKAQLTLGLAALLAHVAGADGPRLTLWTIGTEERPRRLTSPWAAGFARAAFGGRAGLESDPGPALTAGSERLLVSDGLCPGGGASVVQRLGRNAGSICLVQPLLAAELDPQPMGAVRLEDVEGGALDLVHDELACRRYRERFARHQEGWQGALQGRGAGLITCVVEDGLEVAARSLVDAGLAEARAQ